MNRLKRLCFDLFNPKEWHWIYLIKRTIWKIRDYDRMEYDYGCVLCHATLGRMSYTTYELNTIYSEIDDAQRESYNEMLRADINMMIKSGATIEEIQTYVNEL